jgi:hypothetical protein
MNTTSIATIIDEHALIPDVLQAAPRVRPVLDRYGLRGCGGPLGPMETLGFFARAHDVPLDQLLADLRAAVGKGRDDAEPSQSDALADSIYAPFFKGGMAVALTLGAVWGAFLLTRIAVLGSFTAVGIHEVNAHGHAQIFGWVGLFVMGFAYQAFPRFKHASLQYPRLAYATLWMMIAGIILRSGGQAFLTVAPVLIVPAALGSLLEIAAIACFAGIIATTLRRSGKPLAFYDYYVFAAIGWFFIQSVYEAVYFLATATAPSHEALLGLVATWQGPLRDVQIHGFILLMILGVSQRLFHYFYGFPKPSPRVGVVALVCINVAILGEIAGFLLMRTQGHAWAGLWYGAILLLAGTVVALVSTWHIYSKPAESDRSLKYLRTAYGWLFISLAMLVALPAYQLGLVPRFAPHSQAAAIGFSHAYYGAIRHAITVGFISLMIMGVAAKVVPTLKGVDVHQLTPLWAPFMLINLGCATRVTFQTLTDFSPRAFPIAGLSGFLEVTALALWAWHLFGIMRGQRETTVTKELAATDPIRGDHRVGVVVEARPELLPVFLAHGFKPLANPVLRKTMARTISIKTACRAHGVDVNVLLDALNTINAGANPAVHETLD